MSVFILGLSSIFIYYMLLLGWIFLFSKKLYNIDYAMGNIILLIIVTSIFLGGMAVIFGIFKSEKNKKESLLNRIGIIYGIFTIGIWFFLIVFSIYCGFMNFAYATVTMREIKLFKIILTILSTIPVIIGPIFIRKLLICMNISKEADEKN